MNMFDIIEDETLVEPKNRETNIEAGWKCTLFNKYIEKDDYNLSVIFKDVSNFYMDDQTRGKKTKIMKENFVNQINKISSNLSSQGKQNDSRLQKFSQSFKCQL